MYYLLQTGSKCAVSDLDGFLTGNFLFFVLQHLMHGFQTHHRFGYNKDNNVQWIHPFRFCACCGHTESRSPNKTISELLVTEAEEKLCYNWDLLVYWKMERGKNRF